MITTRALNISKKAILPSSQRHSGVTEEWEKSQNHLENRTANYPLPIRSKDLHAVLHIKVHNSASMPHYITEQEDQTDGKMQPY